MWTSKMSLFIGILFVSLATLCVTYYSEFSRTHHQCSPYLEINKLSVPNKEKLVKNKAKPKDETKTNKEVKENLTPKQEILERNICEDNFDDKEIIKANSDPLPNRTWTYNNKTGICEGNDAENCIPGFMSVQRTFKYYVSKPTKTVTCLVHKSMSTVLKTLSCFLDDPLKFLYYENDLLDYEHWQVRGTDEKDCGKYYAENGFNFIFQGETNHSINMDDGWKYLMVVRDPIERFLSGYIHFCYFGHIVDCSRYCNQCGANLTCFLERELENMREVIKTGNITDLKTGHMIPQSWQCELDENFNKFTFLRYHSDSAKFFDLELEPYLKSRNVSVDALYYIRNRLTSARSKHSTSTTTAKTFLEKRIKESPYLIELLLKMFYNDYKAFGLPLPQIFKKL